MLETQYHLQFLLSLDNVLSGGGGKQQRIFKRIAALFQLQLYDR